MTSQPQNLRGLKALVGIMAVLIIIGTTIVVGTVVYRLYARFNAPPTPATKSMASTSPIAPPVLFTGPPPAIHLTSGEHIVEIAPAGPDLAILVAGPQGQELLILNPVSGAIRTALSSLQSR